jgi:hypothetical protein
MNRSFTATSASCALFVVAFSSLFACTETTVVGVERARDGEADQAIQLLHDGSSMFDVRVPDAPLAPPDEGGTVLQCPACGSGSYCRAMEGKCEGKGSCEARPPECPPGADPVCGCDGNTWLSACLANQMGVSVAHAGDCP